VDQLEVDTWHLIKFFILFFKKIKKKYFSKKKKKTHSHPFGTKGWPSHPHIAKGVAETTPNGVLGVVLATPSGYSFSYLTCTSALSYGGLLVRSVSKALQGP
jgi:hypothetical protein